MKTKKKATPPFNLIYGDIWDQDGIKVVSTNLQGVHGRGLAKQAKDMGYITKHNVSFHTSNFKSEVICLAVKGKEPSSAKIPGKAFSERVVGGNLQLLKDELRLFVRYVRENRDKQFYLPYIGMGFGEGNQYEILPMLEWVAKEPNVCLIAKDGEVRYKYLESFKAGIRRDRT